MSNKAFSKGLLSFLLVLSLICTSGIVGTFGRLDVSAADMYISRVVDGENGKYIEHLGEPYLPFN